MILNHTTHTQEVMSYYDKDEDQLGALIYISAVLGKLHETKSIILFTI